jgi:aspartate/methionine/tyrosine aminotransferase
MLESGRLEFTRRRDWLVPALREVGFGVPVVPDGAFYAWAGLQWPGSRGAGHWPTNCLTGATCRWSRVPTSGVADPDRWLRLSFATRLDLIQEAMARIRTHLLG